MILKHAFKKHRFRKRACMALLAVSMLGGMAASPAGSFPARAAEETRPYVDMEFTYDQEEARKMTALVNAFRAEKNLWCWNEQGERVPYPSAAPLVYDYRLERAAMQRAAEISVCYSHTRPNGAGAGLALSDYGYTGYKVCGENICTGPEGYLYFEDAFDAWREEYELYGRQGHRRNMLNPAFTAIGIGHVRRNGYEYWAMELSTVRTGDPDHGIDGTQTVTIQVMPDTVTEISQGVTSMEVGESADAPLFDGMVAPSYLGSEPARFHAFWKTADPQIVKVENGRFVRTGHGSTTAVGTVGEHTFTVTLLEAPGWEPSGNGGGTGISNGNTAAADPGSGDGMTDGSASGTVSDAAGLTAQPVSYNTVRLSWKPVDGAKKYEVYASASKDGGFRKIGNAKKTQFVYKKAACGQETFFQVRALGARRADLGRSGVVSARTSLSGQPALSVKKVSAKSITLKWTKVPGAKRYEVYCSEEGGSFRLLTSRGGTGFTHKGLTAGNTYEYRIRPVRDAFYGGWSNTDAGTAVLSDPAGLTAKVRKSGVQLAWKKGTGVSQYVILAMDASGDWQEIGRSARPAFLDVQGTTGRKYRVYGVSGAHLTKEVETTALF